MSHPRTLSRRAASIILVLLLMSVGCNSEREAEVAMRRQCLDRLGVLYHAYAADKKASPADLETFTAYIDETKKVDDEVANELKKRLAELDIVVFWKATFANDGKSDADHVLAFEASCPGNGGYMVTVGGLVDHVTAKKFGTMTEVARE